MSATSTSSSRRTDISRCICDALTAFSTPNSFNFRIKGIALSSVQCKILHSSFLVYLFCSLTNSEIIDDNLLILFFQIAPALLPLRFLTESHGERLQFLLHQIPCRFPNIGNCFGSIPQRASRVFAWLHLQKDT